MVGRSLLLLFAALFVHVARGAVILGVDFGTNYIKVAYVQPGKMFDIVMNENSKRKTENVLGMDRGQRLYGADAMLLASRDPKHVFLRSRDLLGATLDSPELKHLEDPLHIFYETVEDPETGGFKIVLDKGKPEETAYRPEEVVGMILSYVKKMSAKYVGADVKDCVITVPSHFTQIKREALLSAAEIAGLNVLTLVDENVAAAVQHGIYNEFTNSSHKILVYNMGSASTKVTLFNFFGKPQGKDKFVTQVEVLAKAWDNTLGGDSFDMTMFDMIVQAFDKMHMKTLGDTVKASRRALERIRAQAQKVKTVLSANMEIPVSIESLFKGQDLKMHVTRSEFEKESETLFQRVVAPIEKVLKESGTTVEELYGVELIGGGVRVPRVKEMLAEYLKDKELGNHLNGDEAKAFGAVFIGANMSKAFRVRPVGMLDISVEPVELELKELEGASGDAKAWEKNIVLFNHSTPLDTKKVVSFERETGVLCTLYRLQDDGSKYAVAEYQVTGVEDAIEKFGKYGAPKVSLSFHLTHNDTVGISRAEARFTEIIPEEESDDDKKNEESTEEEKQASNQTTSEETEQKEEEKASSDESKEEKAAGEEDSKSSEKEKEDEKKKSKKPKGPGKKIHKFALTVKRTDSVLKLKPLTAEMLESARELLQKFDAEEDKQRLHEAAKNELESFIFSSRDKVRTHEDDVDKVLEADAKDELFSDMMELEDWLDDEGDSAEIEEFKKRRGELQKRIRKIFQRIEELDQRPASIIAARKLIETVRQQVEFVWPKERPWITEVERGMMLARVSEFESWLNEKEKEQSNISLREDPVLTAAQIASKLEGVQDLLELALRRPPPVPPRKPKKKTNSTEAKADTSGDSEDKENNEEKADEKEEAEKDEL